MIRVQHILFCFFVLASCNQQPAFTETEKQKVQVAVHNMLNEYYSDIYSSGLLAEFKYLDSSTDFFWVPPGYTQALSFDSVAAILRKNAPGLAAVENSFDTLQIIPLSADLAAYTARIRSVVRDTAGMVFTSSLIETGVVVKRANGWKLLNGHTSLVP